MNKEQIADYLYKEIRHKSKTASDYGMCDNDIYDLSNFVVALLSKVELLLKDDESKQPQPPDFANTMLGEVPHEVNNRTEENPKAVEGATPVVRQNEQTKEVCQHELVLIKGKKDWFCWKCRLYEYQIKANRLDASAPDFVS